MFYLLPSGLTQDVIIKTATIDITKLILSKDTLRVEGEK